MKFLNFSNLNNSPFGQPRPLCQREKVKAVWKCLARCKDGLRLCCLEDGAGLAQPFLAKVFLYSVAFIFYLILRNVISLSHQKGLSPMFIGDA